MSDFGGEGGGYTAGQNSQQKTATQFAGGGLPTTRQQSLPGMGQKPAQPRPVSTFKQELVDRPLQDISQELQSFVNLNALLEINPETDSPEQQAHKQQLHGKWQQLSQEQQQLAMQTYQHEMQRKQAVDREDQVKAQQKAAQKAPLAMPSSPSNGPVGPASGNKKKAAATQLQQNRQSFNKVQSSG
jgi:predicted GIY-YIG superfamily endonuclease